MQIINLSGCEVQQVGNQWIQSTYVHFDQDFDVLETQGLHYPFTLNTIRKPMESKSESHMFRSLRKRHCWHADYHKPRHTHELYLCRPLSVIHAAITIDLVVF